MPNKKSKNYFLKWNSAVRKLFVCLTFQGVLIFIFPSTVHSIFCLPFYSFFFYIWNTEKFIFFKYNLFVCIFVCLCVIARGRYSYVWEKIVRNPRSGVKEHVIYKTQMLGINSGLLQDHQGPFTLAFFLNNISVCSLAVLEVYM